MRPYPSSFFILLSNIYCSPTAVSLKTRKKCLTRGRDTVILLKYNKAGTVPRPHPRPEPKGQHGESPPEHLYSAWFYCDAGAIQADAFYFFVWRCFPIANTGHQTNEEIRDKEVRLISESGEQLGIMSSQEALRLAEERELDLVKIFAQCRAPGVQADGLRQVPVRADQA